jgi:S-adenosylhomocysteine hydrolase
MDMSFANQALCAEYMVKKLPIQANMKLLVPEAEKQAKNAQSQKANRSRRQKSLVKNSS